MNENNQRQNAASSELQGLFDEDWEFSLRERPLFATYVGDHRFDDKLGSVTLADQERRNEQAKEFLRRLNEIDRGALSSDEQLNHDIFKIRKENAITTYEFCPYLMPVNKKGGFHSGFAQLPDRVPLNTPKDYENYIARLKAFEPFVDEHIELMRVGMSRGYVPPQVVLEGVEETIKPHIPDEPDKSPLFKAFEKFPEGMDEAERKRLTEDGREAIRDSVIPDYRRLLEFVEKEYAKAGREGISISSLPNGRAYYEHLVRRFTTLDMTPKQVHDTGLAEVRRLREEMDNIIKKVEFDGNFHQFTEFLRTDKRFYVDDPKDLMKETAYILKKMDGELPKLFKTLPRMPYGIKPVPDYTAPNATTAYYSPSPGDGSRAGYYYVNTYDLGSRPLYEMEALSLHEAVPGHHLQLALQHELEGMPQFRRFGGFTAFVEGWALYAEHLGLEVGFYEDPYSDFGRLTYQMWRACRLVVDTGIHYFDWDRQRAVDFMAENTGLPVLNINTEVDRYIAHPGQAIAYKIGELKVSELRRLAEQELGKSFDRREFHDVVLRNGAIPLKVLEANVKKWLVERWKANT